MTAVFNTEHAPTAGERIRDAAWVAFVALVLGIPMIGLVTVDEGGKLMLQTRWRCWRPSSPSAFSAG